jgi:hypothetical protein
MSSPGCPPSSSEPQRLNLSAPHSPAALPRDQGALRIPCKLTLATSKVLAASSCFSKLLVINYSKYK